MVQLTANMTADTGYSYNTNSTYCGGMDSTAASTRSFDILSAANGYDSRMSTVCKRAVLKKAKTNRNKFFVLHKTSSSIPARLEYYDSESHWNKHKKPKRTIYLQTCFSAKPFSNSSVKYGLTLFTNDDSFQMGFPSEQDRDMWMADIMFLSKSNCELPREPVQHEWKVKVSTRNMNCQICGQYSLLLGQRQATLFKKSSPNGALLFPLDVIIRTDHNNNFFIMEVNEVAQTGPGEIWMELEDSLIARHVDRAFTQNISANEEEFRPVSKSLSYKDRKSAFSARLRSGSDAKIRSIAEQRPVTMGQKNTLLMSSNVSISHQRERSDSIDSHGTSVSISTDDSEMCCRSTSDRYCASRSVTPDPRGESWRTGIKKVSDAGRSLTDMSYSSTSQDSNSNFVYIDMTAGVLNQLALPTDGYMDMTCGRRSPIPRAYRPKPETVRSYLMEDDESPQLERRHNSFGSRIQAQQVQRDNEYVEMSRNPLSVKDKCSSAPLLNPLTLSPKSHTAEDLQQAHIPDNRQLLFSFNNVSSHRPRGFSWSQCTRPQSDSKVKSHAKRLQKNQQSKSLCADYIDMTYGSKTDSSYVEMCLNHKNSSRAKQSAEDKENHFPQHQPTNRSKVISEPFPELSASSEDDVSLHSVEGSTSSYSLTSSGDSMSMSSHSPYHSGSITTTPAVTSQMESSVIVSRSSVRVSQRSLQVPSFIQDDMHNSDYMEMSPGNK